MKTESENPSPRADSSCLQCEALVGEDYEVTEAGVICRSCFTQAVEELQETIAAQGKNINYILGTVGALLGGALGALAWWGFTVVTHIAFSLVAVVIGVAVAKGATVLAGNKRSMGLQIISVVVAAISFFYASFLVNRTFVIRSLEEQGENLMLSFAPAVNVMYEVISLDFGVFDILCLGIVAWYAWKIPAPIKLAQ